MKQATKMALFTGLELLFVDRPSLISQGWRQLHSDNINIHEHFGRRLQDAFDVLNIFKNSCGDVLVLRKLISFISDMISQTEMLLNCTEKALSTDREFGMQLHKASSVCRDEIIDNHSGHLGRPRCNVEKEELQTVFDMYHSWTKVASTLGVSERTLRLRRKKFVMTISNLSGSRKTSTKISSNDLLHNFRYFTRCSRDLCYWCIEAMKYSCSETPNSSWRGRSC